MWCGHAPTVCQTQHIVYNVMALGTFYKLTYTCSTRSFNPHKRSGGTVHITIYSLNSVSCLHVLVWRKTCSSLIKHSYTSDICGVINNPRNKCLHTVSYRKKIQSDNVEEQDCKLSASRQCTYCIEEIYNGHWAYMWELYSIYWNKVYNFKRRKYRNNKASLSGISS